MLPLFFFIFLYFAFIFLCFSFFFFVKKKIFKTLWATQGI